MNQQAVRRHWRIGARAARRLWDNCAGPCRPQITAAEDVRDALDRLCLIATRARRGSKAFCAGLETLNRALATYLAMTKRRYSSDPPTYRSLLTAICQWIPYNYPGTEVTPSAIRLPMPRVVIDDGMGGKYSLGPFIFEIPTDTWDYRIWGPDAPRSAGGLWHPHIDASGRLDAGGMTKILQALRRSGDLWTLITYVEYQLPVYDAALAIEPLTAWPRMALVSEAEK